MSPTARTLKFMRDQGYYVWIVEKTIPRTFIKQDAHGWIDIIAHKATGKGVIGIQVTSGSNLAARIHKAAGNGALVAWLLAGNTLRAHGWRKLKGRWAVDEREIGMEDLCAPKVTADQSFGDGESAIP